MIISVTFSKPTKDVEAILGKPFEKIKIKAENSGGETKYFGEFFTKTQVTHKHFTEKELDDFFAQNIGKTFKNCLQRTDKQEILFLTNKKGKITRIAKDLAGSINGSNGDSPAANGDNPLFKNKKYLLPEGSPVPFLVLLGVMTPEGKVISSKYDKFRQINRFLEFINDIIPEVQKLKSDDEETSPIRIADFGCGKSYLTFVVHYFLTEIRHIPCEIEGLDLKQDVINYCNEITKKLGLQNLIFHTGNIADYSNKQNPDIVITLHACDTATYFALQYAVEHKAKAILSVPCCQHEVNKLLSGQKVLQDSSSPFSSLLKWGIIKEKFSSLVTDALRGEWLENHNYKVQMLEFIDMEHTPKNILIRAVKKTGGSQNATPSTPLNTSQAQELMRALGIRPELFREIKI